jgi:hypothetical protein
VQSASFFADLLLHAPVWSMIELLKEPNLLLQVEPQAPSRLLEHKRRAYADKFLDDYKAVEDSMPLIWG